MKGFGQQKGHLELYRGVRVRGGLPAEASGRAGRRDDALEKVTRAIVDACRTGRVGDGKIFVTPITEAVRIRTGERGEEALLVLPRYAGAGAARSQRRGVRLPSP